MTAVVALVAYVLTTTGVPLPAQVAKVSDRPFPCQHHACGCATAEQCWKSCCCYTPRQKLAWAREHGVKPPGELVAEVAHLDDHEHAAVAKRACCAHHDAHDQRDEPADEHSACEHCDHHTGVIAPASVACDKDGCAHRRDNFGCGRAENSKSNHVIGMLALRCRGLSTLWCSCGAVIPAPTAITWQYCWDPLGWLPLVGSSPASSDLAPLLRPPCV